MPILSQTDVAGETVASIVQFLPRLASFVAILLVGYVVARALKRLVGGVLRRVGFERLVARGGISDALARADHDAGDVVSRIVFYGLMLLVLQLAFGVFGPNPVSDLLARVLAFLPRIFVAIVIVVVAAAIASAIRDLVGTLLGGLSYGRLLATAAYGLILGIGVFAALDQLEIAQMIVAGVFYAVLAIVVGVTVVAVGGSGIGPMRQRWERGLARLDDETARIREEVRLQREAQEEAARQREAEEEAARQREAEEEAARQREAEREARVIRSTPREAPLAPVLSPAADAIDDSDDEPLFDPESTTTQIARPDGDDVDDEPLFDPEGTTSQIARPDSDDVDDEPLFDPEGTTSQMARPETDDADTDETKQFDPESTTTQIARPSATERPPGRRTRRRRTRVPGD